MISRRRAFIMLGFLLPCTRLAAAADDDIVGIWCSPKGSGRERPSEWILTGDQEAIFARGGRIETTYEIVGNRIKARTGVEPEGAGPTDMEFQINDDTLTLDRAAKYSRLRGPYPGTHAIVGEWRITHPNGNRASLRFARSGAAQLFFPQGEPVAKSYRREGNVVTINGDSTIFTYDPQRRLLIGPAGDAFWRFEF